MVCTIDFPASFAALAGAKIPEDECLDSINVLGALLGETGAKGRTHLLQQDNSGKQFGLREGNWKLVRNKEGKEAKKQEAVDQLFNLDKYTGETISVAAQQPDKLKHLQSLLAKIIADGRTRAPN